MDIYDEIARLEAQIDWSIIAKIEREIEAKKQAELAELYRDPEEEEIQEPVWKSVRGGFKELAQKPRPGARMIHGIASSSTINSHGYALIARGMSARLPVPLLFAHKGHGAPIGEVFYIRKSDSSVYVRAQLADHEAADYAWSLIMSGEARCLSGAAADDEVRKLQGVVDDKRFYSEWRLTEVSICRKGANPDCVFEVWDGIKKEMSV